MVISYSSDNLPQAAQFSDLGNGAGSFTWQTAAEDAGSYTATFNLSNGEASVPAVTITITVVGAVASPVWLAPPEDVSVNASELIEFSVAAEDPGGLTLVIDYISDDLPETAQFSDLGNGAGSFTWQTTAEDAGSYTAIFNLSNDEVSAPPVTISITIIGAVAPPVWLAPPVDVSVSAGELIEFSVAAEDPGGLTLVIDYISDDLPETAQFSDLGNGAGSFTWQTTAEDAGSYTATFNLSNGEASATPVTITITIVGVAAPPEWVQISDLYEIGEGSLLEFTIIGADPGGGELTIEYSSNDLPESVIFSDFADGTGSFSWQPTYIDAGEYAATFILLSGEQSVEKEVTITVNDIDQPPEWIDIPVEVSGDAGSLIEFDLLGVDFDGDDVTISFIPDNLPETAIFTNTGDGTGTFTWQTTNEDAGFYTATFIIMSKDLSVSSTVGIIVE